MAITKHTTSQRATPIQTYVSQRVEIPFDDLRKDLETAQIDQDANRAIMMAEQKAAIEAAQTYEGASQEEANRLVQEYNDRLSDMMTSGDLRGMGGEISSLASEFSKDMQVGEMYDVITKNKLNYDQWNQLSQEKGGAAWKTSLNTKHGENTLTTETGNFDKIEGYRYDENKRQSLFKDIAAAKDRTYEYDINTQELKNDLGAGTSLIENKDESGQVTGYTISTRDVSGVNWNRAQLVAFKNAMASEDIHNAAVLEVANDIVKDNNGVSMNDAIDMASSGEYAGEVEDRVTQDIIGRVNAIAGYNVQDRTSFQQKKEAGGSGSKDDNELIYSSRDITAPLPDKMITINSAEENTKQVFKQVMGSIYGSNDLIGPSVNALFRGKHTLQKYDNKTGTYSPAEDVDYFWDEKNKQWAYEPFLTDGKPDVEKSKNAVSLSSKLQGLNDLGKQQFLLQSFLDGKIYMDSDFLNTSETAGKQLVTKMEDQLAEINLAIEQDRQINNLARQKAFIATGGKNDPSIKIHEMSMENYLKKDDNGNSFVKESFQKEIDGVVAYIDSLTSVISDEEKIQVNKVKDKLNGLKSDDEAAADVLSAYGRYANETFTTNGNGFAEALSDYLGESMAGTKIGTYTIGQFTTTGTNTRGTGEGPNTIGRVLGIYGRSATGFNPKRFEEFERIDERYGSLNSVYKQNFEKAKADIETELKDNFLSMQGYTTFPVWEKSSKRGMGEKEYKRFQHDLLYSVSDGPVNVEIVSDNADEAGSVIKTDVSFREYKQKMLTAPKNYKSSGEPIVSVGYRFDENRMPETIMTITQSFSPSADNAHATEITREGVFVIPNSVHDISRLVPQDELNKAQSFHQVYMNKANDFINRSAMPSVPANFLPNVSLFKNPDVRKDFGNIEFDKEHDGIPGRIVWKKPGTDKPYVVAVDEYYNFKEVLAIFSFIEEKYSGPNGLKADQAVRALNEIMENYFKTGDEIKYNL
jgi:hypothetical protein